MNVSYQIITDSQMNQLTLVTYDFLNFIEFISCMACEARNVALFIFHISPFSNIILISKSTINVLCFLHNPYIHRKYIHVILFSIIHIRIFMQFTSADKICIQIYRFLQCHDRENEMKQ